jgi:hypothetical protein
MIAQEWVEVANASDVQAARRQFAEVLSMYGVDAEDVDPEDIRIDTIRGEARDHRRILVRREIARRIGLPCW